MPLFKSTITNRKSKISLARARRRPWRAALFAIPAALALAGCGGHFLIFPGTAAQKENYDLHRENSALKDQVNHLKQDLNLRIEQVNTLMAATTPNVLRNAYGVQVPRLVAIQFGNLSGVLNPGLQAKTPTLRLYLLTLDEEGRFIPVAGQASVQAVWLDPGKTPVILGDRTIDPVAFDQAYRSSFTGTHYSLDIPLPVKLPTGANSVTVKIDFQDAATGATISAQRDFPIPRATTQPASSAQAR